MAEKKAKAPKQPKAPTSAEALVNEALKKAATDPKAAWMAASAKGLFNTKEENHQAAIEACTKSEPPLLKQVGKTGVLTAAGFARIAGELSDADATAAYERLAGEVADDEAGTLAKAVALRLPTAERIEFIRGVLGRTPLAALELTPVLEEAVSAAKAEDEARLAAARKRADAERAAEAAMRRALELFAEHRKNRLETLRREYEIEGGKASDLLQPKEEPRPRPPEPKPPVGPGPEAKTDEEKDFRRYSADRFAAAWRDAWDAGRNEGREDLETAIWNIRGMRVIGEAGQEVPFDGRLHESERINRDGQTVRIVRPGWLLKIDDEDYVALKATVE